MKYQSPSTYHSKVIAKVKVTDRMTEGQNDRQDKNNMPPDLRSRGHKNNKLKKKKNSTFTFSQFIGSYRDSNI